jgi:hypothetical protein
MLNALTIDVEDWFHVCGDDYYSDPRRWDSFAPRVERNMEDLLRRLGDRHRATFFFLGWDGSRTVIRIGPPRRGRRTRIGQSWV